MLIRSLRGTLEQVRPYTVSSPNGVSDADLLERFLTGRDEAAFELLVWRHGPLVLGVCRRVLGDQHDAEDAFQATFFALAQKAGSIGRRDSLSAWLYKVAYRIALRARAQRARREGAEVPLGETPVAQPGKDPAEESAWRELAPLLDSEVKRLPEKYRLPFILCYFEGKTNEAAAAELGCPRGTILSRLARARERLRARLGLHGLMGAAAPFALLLAHNVRSLVEVSPVLVNAAVHLAILLPAARLAAGLSAAPIELAEAVLRDMRRAWVRQVAALAAAAVLLLGAAGGAVAAAAGLLPGSGDPPAAVGGTGPVEPSVKCKGAGPPKGPGCCHRR
jgi:RNA polymerase sigma factor (sigma-70 family)